MHLQFFALGVTMSWDDGFGWERTGSAGVPPARVGETSLAQPRPSPPLGSTGNGAMARFPSAWPMRSSRPQGGCLQHRTEARGAGAAHALDAGGGWGGGAAGGASDPVRGAGGRGTKAQAGGGAQDPACGRDARAPSFELVEQRRLGTVDLLVRAQHNRRLGRQLPKLFERVRAAQAQAGMEIEVGRRSRRATRQQKAGEKREAACPGRVALAQGGVGAAKEQRLHKGGPGPSEPGPCAGNFSRGESRRAPFGKLPVARALETGGLSGCWRGTAFWKDAPNSPLRGCGSAGFTRPRAHARG